MCKASLYAKWVVEAQAGQHLEVDVSGHGLGAFHDRGTSVEECLVCVKDGTELTLRSIPAELQERHNIGPMEVVTFIDTGDNKQDLVRFDNGAEVPLVDFAQQGVAAYVGVLQTPEKGIGGVLIDDIYPDGEGLGIEKTVALGDSGTSGSAQPGGSGGGAPAYQRESAVVGDGWPGSR